MFLIIIALILRYYLLQSLQNLCFHVSINIEVTHVYLFTLQFYFNICVNIKHFWFLYFRPKNVYIKVLYKIVYFLNGKKTRDEENHVFILTFLKTLGPNLLLQDYET